MTTHLGGGGRDTTGAHRRGELDARRPSAAGAPEQGLVREDDGSNDLRHAIILCKDKGRRVLTVFFRKLARRLRNFDTFSFDVFNCTCNINPTKIFEIDICVKIQKKAAFDELKKNQNLLPLVKFDAIALNNGWKRYNRSSYEYCMFAKNLELFRDDSVNLEKCSKRDLLCSKRGYLSAFAA